jgi:hypothetical protein
MPSQKPVDLCVRRARIFAHCVFYAVEHGLEAWLKQFAEICAPIKVGFCNRKLLISGVKQIGMVGKRQQRQPTFK